jgi:hypothetical protein
MANSKTKTGSSKKRGFATAVQGAANKGYNVAGYLGDAEIAVEQIQNKFTLVLCSVILFCLVLSIIYQIINIIKILITGVSLCDTFDICDEKPDPANNKSGYLINMTSSEKNPDGSEKNLNDQHGNIIVLFIFFLAIIMSILALSAAYSSHRLNDVAKHNSAYRAIKGAQLVGNVYNQVRKKK